MNSDEQIPTTARKGRMENALYFFYTALPWVHFFIMIYCLNSEFGPSVYFFEEVGKNYRYVHANDPVAMHTIDVLGRSITTSQRFVSTFNFFLLASLPFNFAVCHYTKKIIDRWYHAGEK